MMMMMIELSFRLITGKVGSTHSTVDAVQYSKSFRSCLIVYPFFFLIRKIRVKFLNFINIYFKFATSHTKNITFYH
jgi:hypothetical protein